MIQLWSSSFSMPSRGGIRSPHALHDVYPDPDSKIASFYCAECRHCYCTDHWKLREVYEPDTGYFEAGLYT